MLLTVDGVHKKLGDRQVLSDLSFEVRPNERIVLFGASGCGKTTTLRLIVGLDQPDTGRILWHGAPISRTASQRPISIVMQNGGFYDHLDVAGNLELAAKASSRVATEREQRIREIADLLELTPCMKQRPAELSGGQLQRLALGRALVRDCQLLLLDEPLSHLDFALRHRLRELLLDLQSRLGFAMIYVTHDPIEAMVMGQRIAVLDQGRILQYDLPEQLYNHPRELTVAQTLGWPPMDIFHGVLLMLSGEPAVTIQQQSIHIDADRLSLHTIERLKSSTRGIPCKVGIRPEDWQGRVLSDRDSMSLRPAAGSDVTGDALRIAAQIQSCQSLGAASLYRVQSVAERLTEILGSSDASQTSAQSHEPITPMIFHWLQSKLQQHGTSNREQNDPLNSEPISLSVPACRLHLFDPSTGSRM